MNKYIKKIDDLRCKRGWSFYRLAQASKVDESTINGGSIMVVHQT